MHSLLILVFSLTGLVNSQGNQNTERPFYIIGHMVNSIPQVKEFLNSGANALESDISFFPNGSVKEVYHGPPCDCFRNCSGSAKLSEYLDHVREVTDPSCKGSYYKQMTFQMFDMKLTTVTTREGKYFAGQDIADHVLDHLWGKNYGTRGLVKVVLYINTVTDAPTIKGFIDRFNERDVTELLKNIGYDGGVTDSSDEIRKMFESLHIQSGIWQGDGIFNCLSPIYPDFRLRQEVQIRDQPGGYIDKVYHWTIDNPQTMTRSFRLGVDGMITNVPRVAVHILDEYFSNSFRLATTDDNPFIKYINDANGR